MTKEKRDSLNPETLMKSVNRETRSGKIAWMEKKEITTKNKNW